MGVDRRVPSYEIAIENGEKLYHSRFANGKSLADCFGPEGAVRGNTRSGIRSGMVVTMERAVNECREANGEKPYGWKKGKIADVTAYMSYNSRGQEVRLISRPMILERSPRTRMGRSTSTPSAGS